MVLIHPTACSPAKIAAIQLSTGLRAVTGKRHARLVTQDGNNPVMRSTKKPVPYSLGRDPHDGGHAA